MLLNKIANLGITNQTPQEQQKKIRIINNGAFYGCLILFSYALVNTFLGYPLITVINLAFTATAITILILNSKKQYNTAVYVVLLVSPLHILSFVWFVGEIGAEYYIVLLVSIGIYVIDSRRKLNLISGYLVVNFIIAKAILHVKTYTLEYQMFETWYYYPNLMLFVVLIIIVGYIFKFDTIRYQKIIEKQTRDLANQVNELDKGKRLLSNLLKELNHRVKNNLQMVSGLLSMQSRNSIQPETKQKLANAVNRIDSLVLLHQQLYKNAEDSKPNIKVYIEKLVDHIIYASGNENILSLHKEIDNFSAPIDFAIHIGLIVNELITNALKYGIDNDSRNNRIRVTLSKKNNRILLLVSDTGKGLPDNFKIKTGGLDLVKSIANKYHGNVILENNDEGAMITVELFYIE